MQLKELLNLVYNTTTIRIFCINEEYDVVDLYVGKMTDCKLAESMLNRTIKGCGIAYMYNYLNIEID